MATHPIQYYSPVFRALSGSGELCIRVFFTWSQAALGPVFDSGFGAAVQWDLPLLEGFDHQFVRNVARRPGLDHFFGLNTPALVGEILAWGADAALIYTWNSWSHLQALRRLRGKVPIFFRGDSTLIDPRPRWRAAMRRAFLAWLYRHVDVAIAVGTRNREYFAWCGMPPGRIALAPHSVDTVRFAADAAAHERRAAGWRRELKIPDGSLVILFAGKLQPKKNPMLLLDSFAAMAGRAHLVFVGNGELENVLKERARGIDNVHFMPFQNQSAMPAVYRLGDVFVLPSQGPEETWGLALNEAMASGRPVIASSRVGGACDLVCAGENGWVFASGDGAQLRAILMAAMQLGKSGLAALGHAAQKHSERFSTQESARCIAAAVSKVLAPMPG